MSVTADQYRRARHMAEPAAELLLEIIRPDNRGRASLHPRVFLTGLLLSIDTNSQATITGVHKVLTVDLPRELQWDLGVLTGPARAPKMLTVDQLYKLTKRVSSKLDHTKSRASHLSDLQRYERRDAVDRLTTVLLAPTLIERDRKSADYALDGTGIWAAERSPRKIEAHAEPADVDEDSPDYVEQVPEPDLGGSRLGRGSKGASDAHGASKTAKDGSRENYFGYDVEALIRVPPTSGPGITRTEPQLVERLVVLPGSTDVVEPCLALIDSLLSAGMPVRSVVVDRHYSYKKFDRWLQGLMTRNVHQVADLRDNDQGFRDWDGMRIAAAWPHCPATPDRLGVISTLGPNASHDDRTQFATNIAERQSYAVQFVNRLDTSGKMKVRCPARNGTVGCPLVDGTEATAIAHGLPIVADPPVGEHQPRICCNDTVTMSVQTTGQKMAMKLAQRHYWGSEAWRNSYRRRTYIEGWFGVLKSNSATGTRRGTHQFRGLALVSIVLACAAAVTNQRLLRSWHNKTGLGDEAHPLLAPDQPFHGFTQLDAEQAAAIDIECAPQASRTALAKSKLSLPKRAA